MSNKKAIDELLKQSNETIHKITVENIKKQTAFLESFVKNSHNIDVKIHKMRKDEYSKLMNLEYDFINNKKKIAYENYKEEIEALSLQKEQNKKQLEEHKKHLYEMYKAQGHSDEYIADKIKKSVADSEKYHKEEIDKLQKNIDKYKAKYRKEREVLKKFEKNTSALTRAMNMVGGSVDGFNKNNTILSNNIKNINNSTNKFKTILLDFENAFDSQLKKSSPMLAYFKNLLFTKKNKDEKNIVDILKKGTNINSKKSKVSSPKNGQEQVKGRYSDKEIAYIKKKYRNAKSIPKIASGLNRPEKSVKIKIKKMKEKGELRDVERVNPFSMFEDGLKKIGGIFKTEISSLGTKLNKLKSISTFKMVGNFKMLGYFIALVSAVKLASKLPELFQKQSERKFGKLKDGEVLSGTSKPNSNNMNGVPFVRIGNSLDNREQMYSRAIKKAKLIENPEEQTKRLKEINNLYKSILKNRDKFKETSSSPFSFFGDSLSDIEEKKLALLYKLEKFAGNSIEDVNINSPIYKDRFGLNFEKVSTKRGGLASKEYKLSGDILSNKKDSRILKFIGEHNHKIFTPYEQADISPNAEYLNSDVSMQNNKELLQSFKFIKKQDRYAEYNYNATDEAQRDKALSLLNDGYVIRPHVPDNEKLDDITKIHLAYIKRRDSKTPQKQVLPVFKLKLKDAFKQHMRVGFNKDSNGMVRQKKNESVKNISNVGKKLSSDNNVNKSINNRTTQNILEIETNNQQINNNMFVSGDTNVHLVRMINGLTDKLECEMV